MSGSIYDLIEWRRWRLSIWKMHHSWKWLPERKAYWSGKVRHWYWLCFDLCHDARTDVLGDWMRGGRKPEPDHD